MAAKVPRFSKEEFAKRGEAIFEKEIRPSLGKQNPRHFLAIEIETGAYEIDTNEMTACDRLEARIPDAQSWITIRTSIWQRKGDKSMIKGVVNSDLEATLRLIVRGPDGRTRRITAVIDCGSNGFLSLPLTMIEELDLPWKARTLAEWAHYYRWTIESSEFQ
jgi:hypothetical protein